MLCRGWLALLLLLMLPARAGDFELQAASYFGEPVPLGVPGLFAEIQNNTSQAVAGRVEVLAGEERLGWAELQLPPTTRRRTELRLNGPPQGGGDRLEVRLLVGDRMVARKTIRWAWFNAPTLVLSPSPGLVGLYNAYEAHQNQAGTTRAVVQAPETSRAYQGASLVILHDAAGLALTPAQMSALASYVRDGGELLILANQDPREYQGTPLESLLPLKPSGVAELQAGYTVLTGEVPPHDTVLVRREGHPLLITGNRGLGHVHLITAAMLSARLLGEKTTFALFDRLTRTSTDGRRWQPQELWGVSHQGRLRFSTIALGVGLYFLTAGPLNFLFLRNRQRRVWVLVTLPLLAVLFSALVLLYTGSTRGFQPRLQQFGLLRVESGQAGGLYEAAIFLDSLWEGKYTLECGGEAELAGGNLYPWDGVESETGLGLCEGRLQWRDLPLNAWSGTTLSLSESVALAGPLTLDLQANGERLTGTVRNATGWTLEGCQLSLKGKSSARFELPPGDLPVALDLSPFGPGPEQLDRAAMRRSLELNPQNLYLTGFLPASLDPVTARAITRRRDLTMVVVRRRP